MAYRKITNETAEDLLLANEPFELFGKMIVNRVNEEWSYEIERFDRVESMTFPEEDYQFEAIEKAGFAIGAYEEGICKGLAIYEHHWNKYLYLCDLKVVQKNRKQGVATNLIKAGQQYAKELGYKGIYTIGQDNNLAACQFYLKQGFVIGGFNNHDYNHTQQEGKADIFFYLENES